MRMIHSYSALAEWKQCPRLHKAKYIDKKIKFVENPAIIKGNVDHKILEMGFAAKDVPPAEYTVTPGLWDRMQALRAKPEKQSAMDRDGRPCGFFEKGKVWLRGKIDLYAGIPHTGDRPGAIMIDWKSGNSNYTDTFQADVYGAMEWAQHGSKETLFIWQYIRRPLKDNPPPIRVRNERAYEQVVDLMERVEADDEHPPRPSWKCRFCDVKTCEYNENKR